MSFEKNLTKIEHLAIEPREMIEKYVNHLLEYNKKINLISRRITRDEVKSLVKETFFLDSLISKSMVVDIGSGNGLLGIPIAILNRNKNVILVESKVKKQNFLTDLITQMGLDNISVQKSDVQYFINSEKKRINDSTAVARGFPCPDILVSYLIKGIFTQLFIITSKRKIIKMKKGLESIEQKIYNIPFRNNIVIWKMENVSRETRSKKL